MTDTPVSPDSMRLRPVDAGDEQLLLTWRNNPLTVKNSGNPRPVSPEEHRTWFHAALADPDRLLFVAESEGDAVGMVRAAVEPSACTGGSTGRGHGGAAVGPGAGIYKLWDHAIMACCARIYK